MRSPIERAPQLLIVDDDPLVLASIARLLRARAVPHATFGSIDSVLAALEQLKPAAVLTDLHFGESRTGIHVLQAVRTRWPNVKRVLMSASELDSSTHPEIELVAHRFLAKPFDSRQFAELLQWLLE